jgi:predicted acyltransferase
LGFPFVSFVSFIGGYWFFNHSLWNGLTVADLVFPWFIYIMGVAMPLSFQALLKNEVTPMQILAKIFRRSIILFALGMYINNGQCIRKKKKKDKREEEKKEEKNEGKKTG